MTIDVRSPRAARRMFVAARQNRERARRPRDIHETFCTRRGATRTNISALWLVGHKHPADEDRDCAA